MVIRPCPGRGTAVCRRSDGRQVGYRSSSCGWASLLATWLVGAGINMVVWLEFVFVAFQARCI